MHRFLRLCLAHAALLPLVSCAQASEMSVPLERAAERLTPLHFGLYVTPDPAQNPIDPPERFTGYHAATDYEIFPEEAEAAVAVRAICDGEIAAADWAEGYGGVILQRCRLADEEVTVIYGHLDPDSFAKQSGQLARKGERLAVLAPARSRESDGNRKHLHLGIHKGRELEFRGYVQEAAELEEFIDPQTVLEH